jgi:uncharacterized lipoprotein YmbA
MKRFLIHLALLTVAALMQTGCSMKSSYYVLSNPSETKQVNSMRHLHIGVERVELPKYLFKREIAVANSSSQIRFLSDGTWAEDLDEGLTHRIIAYLQQRFDQPHVYAYPWDTDRQPDIIVKVQISRFIAKEGKVYLDAAWEIRDLRRHKSIARLFHRTVQTDETARGIVDAMDRVMGYLEEDIAKRIESLR